MVQTCSNSSMCHKSVHRTGTDTACLSWGFTTCPGSLPSSHGEKHPDPKSGRDLDPDKLGCTTSCRGDETDPNVLHTLKKNFVLNIRPFATDPRVGCRVGSS